MFEISMGNWVVTCRLLFEHVDSSWGLFYVIYRGCFLFALIKVTPYVLDKKCTIFAEGLDFFIRTVRISSRKSSEKL